MRSLAIVLLAACAGLLAGCERPPVQTVQIGYRGTGMEQVFNPRIVAATQAKNVLPADTPPVPADGPKASETFKNVKVLGDLSVGEFTRHMVTITQWVAPVEGCGYCHNLADLADDSKYAKVVSRRMIEMTRHINADWKTHVADTGVTCYTCHRGNPVPENLWFAPAPGKKMANFVGDKAGQNAPAAQVGLSSLPNDPFSSFLSKGAQPIRVAGTTALPAGNRMSIKQTEWTYGLMMHMSQSLGVNCTYCHNTQNFGNWAESTPQRVTAWHGLNLVRDLNAAYLEPLAAVLPPERMGPTGDGPKLNCATCHQGVYKPLYGASQLKDHPELGGVKVAVAMPAGLPPTEGSATGATLYFAVGSAALAGDAATGMAQLVASLKANPAAKAVISGFHSASGDAAQNAELAKQRAFAVRDALKAAGLAEDRVVLEKPQVTAGNASGEDPKSRRVEVALK
jgi:photosynthetic reaction center cytochrome c subunit